MVPALVISECTYYIFCAQQYQNNKKQKHTFSFLLLLEMLQMYVKMHKYNPFMGPKIEKL